MIPYGRQDISEADINAVVDVLRSNWLTQGPAVERFETSVADYCGAKHALAVCNATAALHLACRALGVGPGDMVWTSPNTFVASSNAALYCGADIDFVDIDARTYNMSVASLEAKLIKAKQAGRLPKVVVVVHFAGQPCEMAAIAELSRAYGFAVIEDAAHAIGARYRNEPVGRGRFSDITIFSFHPVKVVTTGEGGMLLTNRKDLYDALALLRSHGITRDAALMTEPTHGAWYYQQIDLGYNYRMCDIQAALGESQVTRLDAFCTRRRELTARYDALLVDLPVITPWQHPDGLSAWHLYMIQIDSSKTTKLRAEVFNALRAADIGVHVHYIPVHTQPYYRGLGFKDGDFPVAENYYAHAITLPCFYGLTDAEQDYIVTKLREALA